MVFLKRTSLGIVPKLQVVRFYDTEAQYGSLSCLFRQSGGRLAEKNAISADAGAMALVRG